MPLIDEHTIQAAFDYFHEHGDAAAQAKADLIIAEFRRKKTRSQLICECEERTQSAKEAWADCQPELETAYENEAEAAKKVAWHAHQRARADAIISAWQTQESSRRALARVA